MGRRKTYDREEIARKAMKVFWLHGFDGTSTEALVAAMGVNRFSLYAEFGSKQGLYEAALELYEREVVATYFAELETATAGLAEIGRVLNFFASNAQGPGSELGCFSCNAATERAPHDPASHDHVASYIARITAALTNALANARAAGEIKANAVVVEEAQLLASMLLGFFVLLRAQAPPPAMQGATRAALRHLDTLRVRSATSPVDRASQSSA